MFFNPLNAHSFNVLLLSPTPMAPREQSKLIKLALGCFAPFAFPAVAYADMIWPALVLETKLLSVPIILTSLLIEALVLKVTFTLSIQTALSRSIVINLASALCGILFIPMAGVIWEFFPGLMLYPLLGVGTFNPLTWTATFLMALAITTCIELAVLRRFYGLHIRQKDALIWTAANLVTVGWGLRLAVSGPFHA